MQTSPDMGPTLPSDGRHRLIEIQAEGPKPPLFWIPGGFGSVRMTRLRDFAARIGLLGALNSLSQIALKLTLPGVPDFYQGTEAWDLAMVDPDNRRPVDFDLRRQWLGTTTKWPELAHSWQDGRIKFALIQTLLRVRAELSALFREGDYQPVELTGPDADRAVAFARGYGKGEIIVIVGRHMGPLTHGGRNWPRPLNVHVTRNGASAYRNVLNERAIDLSKPLVLPHFPVGVFLKL